MKPSIMFALIGTVLLLAGGGLVYYWQLFPASPLLNEQTATHALSTRSVGAIVAATACLVGAVFISCSRPSGESK